jgi:serine/threonine-protein kinase
LLRLEYRVLTATRADDGLKIMEREEVHVVMTDQRMPGMTGVEMLRELRKAMPQTVRLLLTGYSDLAALVGSINDGEIFRFVKKPWDNEEIHKMVEEAAAAAEKLAAAKAPAPAAAKAAVAPSTPTPAPSPRTAGSLLVIDPGQSLAKGLERLVAGEATVQLVSTVPEAAKLLQSNEYAAIIADLRAGKEDLVKLFRVVKAKRPGTLSILVADEPDADLVAELINQAQIYRFLAKPIDGKVLRSHVSAALRHYAEFKQAAKKPSGLAENVGARPDRLVTGAA